MQPKDLLGDLKERGGKTIGLEVSDDNQAMLNAIIAFFPDSARQRCVMHKMEKVLSYLPSRQQEQLKPELRALFSQKDRQAADQTVAAFIEKYQSIYPHGDRVFAARSGGLPDLLRLLKGASENHSHQSCHRASFRGGEAPLP